MERVVHAFNPIFFLSPPSPTELGAIEEMSEEEKWWKKDKEKIERIIRLAYVMGSLRSMYEEDIEELHIEGVEGDDAMFAIPKEVQVDIITDGEDVFRLGEVTVKDVRLILKVVYGDDYDYFMARGRRLRKKAKGKKE